MGISGDNIQLQIHQIVNESIDDFLLGKISNVRSCSIKSDQSVTENGTYPLGSRNLRSFSVCGKKRTFVILFELIHLKFDYRTESQN